MLKANSYDIQFDLVRTNSLYIYIYISYVHVFLIENCEFPT